MKIKTHPRKICNRFWQDGKTCKYFMEGGTCKLGDRLYCLISKKMNTITDCRAIDKLSSSALDDFDRCKRMFWYKRLKRIHPRSLQEPLWYGAYGHFLIQQAVYFGHPLPKVREDFLKGRDEWEYYSKETRDDALILMAEVEAFVTGLAPRLIEILPRISIIEDYVDEDFYTGYIDMALTYEIHEWKFVKTGIQSHWSVRRQGGLYLNARPEAKDIVITSFIKPTFKQKLSGRKPETREQFLNRLKDAGGQPKAIQQLRFPREMLDVEAVFREFTFSYEDVKGRCVGNIDEWQCNPKNCAPFPAMVCPYLPICETGLVDEEKFYWKPVRNVIGEES